MSPGSEAMAAKSRGKASRKKAAKAQMSVKKKAAPRKVVAYNRDDPRVRAIFAGGGVNAAIGEALKPPAPEAPPAEAPPGN